VRGYRPPRPGTPLTLRERRVLALTGRGLPSYEIARRLHWGLDTIKDDRRRIRGRLGARNMAHAYAIAFRRGQVS
jgi:DNA-binding CsgD family transcriptional regulator